MRSLSCDTNLLEIKKSEEFNYKALKNNRYRFLEIDWRVTNVLSYTGSTHAESENTRNQVIIHQFKYICED